MSTAGSTRTSGFIATEKREKTVRPLGIVLAIASGTLILSYPFFDFGYSQVSSELPSEMLIIAGALMVVAIIVAAFESWDQNDDADRLANATEESARAISRVADTILIATRSPASVPPSPLLAPPPEPSATPSPTGERFCPWCGTASARSSAFCNRCGRPLPHPSIGAP